MKTEITSFAAIVALGLATAASARDAHTDGVDISDDNTALEDIYVEDDGIIDGVLCVGNTCTSGMALDSTLQVLRLDYTRPHLYFHDNSGAGSPANDWRILINDNETVAEGGLKRFAIQDMSNLTDPFVIEAGAPTNAFWLATSGDVGFGTSLPQADLHVVDGNTPTIRLEQEGSGALTPRSWEIFGNSGIFGITDVTGGTIPFIIDADAPTNTLVVGGQTVWLASVLPTLMRRCTCSDRTAPPGFMSRKAAPAQATAG